MKTILITGGNDGLGKALAVKINAENHVVIVGRQERRLREVADSIGCGWFVCDVRDPNQVERVVEEIASKYRAIDILVNNAGVIVNGELVDTRNEDIENVIATNTLGSIYMTKAVLRHMTKRKSGKIINVVSQSGLNARAERSVYNASKFALTGFTKALQQEAAQYGVSVAGFYPGTIETDFFRKAGIERNGPTVSTDDAARALEFMISYSDDVTITELGIKPTEGWGVSR